MTISRPAPVPPETAPDAGPAPLATTRRQFLQYTLASSATLIVGGVFVDPEQAHAQIDLGEILDFGDVVILAESPYATNLVLEVTAAGRIRFELPRLDKGQGIATAVAMLVADELDADYECTDVVLSDRRADRPFSITGNSAAMRAMWGPVRSLAAYARARLVTAAALRWNVNASLLTTAASTVRAPDGRTASYGELSAAAAGILIPLVSSQPKAVASYKLVGTGRPRKNAREIVTGQLRYTLDSEVPGALPTVIARSPDIGGSIAAWSGSGAASMPGVVGITQIPSGIAVTARTFHEAFAARDALQITWRPGPVANLSDADMRNTLRWSNPPLVPILFPFRSYTASFEFPYAAHATMEVMSAIADVRGGEAEIWYASQSPNFIASQVAQATGVGFV